MSGFYLDHCRDDLAGPRIKVFNTEQMNHAAFAFRRHEDASLRYTGLESPQGLSHIGLFGVQRVGMRILNFLKCRAFKNYSGADVYSLTEVV